MKRLFDLAARLYPRDWRDRYGLEFQALLDDMKPGWRDIADVLAGGLQMHVRRAHPAVIAATVGIIGACAAGVVAVSMADRFISTGTMNVRPAGPSTEPGTAKPDVMPRLAQDAFSHKTLAGIIEKYDLYASERAQASPEAVIDHMRGDIGVQLVSPSVFQVSFASSDGRKAQQVAHELMAQLVRSNMEVSGSVVQVLDVPDEGQVSINSRRVTLAGVGGFGGGALLGTVIGFLRRRSSQPGRST